MAGSSDADVVLRKRVVRHFPTGKGCPFRAQYDLWFVATTSEARLIFERSADPPGSDPEENTAIGSLYVVDEGEFERNYRSAASEEEPCWEFEGLEGYFPYYQPGDDTSEALEDASPEQWTLVNASLGGGVTLGLDPLQSARATVRVTGLTPGRKYFVAGWSNGGGFTVAVDTPRPAAFFLQNGRFKLELVHDGTQPAGGKVVSEQSAVFWFRDPLKTELIINVTDRCQDRGKYHVQVGGTTATRVSIVITDLQNGRTVRYQNRQGTRFQPKLDQTTFGCR
jgi:hypothetical protein